MLHHGLNGDGAPESDPSIKKIRYSAVLVSVDNSIWKSN